MRKKYPDVSIGIHWNLTAGYPTLSAEKVPTLINNNGQFYNPNEFKILLKKKRISVDEIKAELINIKKEL